MGPNERLFDPQYSKELLRIAEGDLKSSVALNKSKEGRLENIFFLSEQTIEKSLKAVLCFYKLPIPFSHDLGLILGMLSTKTTPPHAKDIPALTQHATIRRYEEGSYTPTKEECDGIVLLAENILKWAQGICR